MKPSLLLCVAATIFLMLSCAVSGQTISAPRYQHRHSEHSKPIIRRLAPDSVELAAPPGGTVTGSLVRHGTTLLKVKGNDFQRGAVMVWGGKRIPATFVSASELEVTLDWAKLEGAKRESSRQDANEPSVWHSVVRVTVRNPDGKSSPPVPFRISLHVLGG